MHPLLLLLPVVACATTTAAAQQLGDPARGLAYAKQYCAECHAVQASQELSRSPGPASFKTIANSPGMTAIALSAWLRTPHDKMPNFVISQGDREDVISYIVSLREAPSR